MPLDIESVRAQFPHRRIDYHSRISSTMHEAAQLAAAGAPHGTTVIAEEQTEGIGRYQRAWHSEPESGLYASAVLRPRLTPDKLSFVTLALGLATVESIANVTGIACDLRWPNDVLIHDRKCAGILTRSDGSGIVAGIGVNVNHAVFPEDLQANATSLRIASGRVQPREALLAALLPAIDSFCHTLETQGRDVILEMFSHASSYVRGRRVQVELDGALLAGVTAGLTPEGFLILRDDQLKEHVILAGGVRPCS